MYCFMRNCWEKIEILLFLFVYLMWKLANCLNFVSLSLKIKNLNAKYQRNEKFILKLKFGLCDIFALFQFFEFYLWVFLFSFFSRSWPMLHILERLPQLMSFKGLWRSQAWSLFWVKIIGKQMSREAIRISWWKTCIC